ncbi:hypothetical protein [Halocatena marina]|uniref:hypothetical protein n=1 Tax=Halocatena marina TaxID=2934937 RepID=UPI0020102A04|nr:hypothetical protein [Halocatena marina]
MFENTATGTRSMLLPTKRMDDGVSPLCSMEVAAISHFIQPTRLSTPERFDRHRHLQNDARMSLRYEFDSADEVDHRENHTTNRSGGSDTTIDCDHDHDHARGCTTHVGTGGYFTITAIDSRFYGVD